MHTDARKSATELLDFLLPIVPSSLLSSQNHAGSTPLHWAALNSQLSTARALVNFPGGLGIDLIDIKNAAGRSSLAEAEVAGWDEGAKWMVEVMRLDDARDVEGGTPLSEDQVELEDTDGRTASMLLASVEKPQEEGDSLPL
jgi:ankyrin repeat protein